MLVSAWTAAMIAGLGWADSTRSTSTGLAPLVLDRDDLGTAAGRDVAHPLAEETVDRDHDDVAVVDGVDERRLHAGRAGGRDRQGAGVRRAPHLAQHLARLVHDLQERRVEVPEQRPRRARRSPPGRGSTGPGPKRCRSVDDGSRPCQSNLQDRAGVEDAVRVEGVLDPPGQRHHVGAELLRAAHPALALPTPCSPVIVPPSAIAARHHLAERLPRPPLGVGVARGRRRCSGGCCRRRRARPPGSRRRTPRRPRPIASSRSGSSGHRDADVLEQQRRRATRAPGTTIRRA